MTGSFLPSVGPVARLIEEFHRLPGVGPKTAQRLTYHLIRASSEEARALAEAIIEMKQRTQFCGVCQNISESPTCSICRDVGRDRSTICVVEEPLDMLAIDRTRAYPGLYHILHGVISPMDGVQPEDLKIGELLERLRSGSVSEVIIATNLSLEGEATAMYLQSLITPLEVRVTRLAQGLPSGGDLEYADEVTLSRALEGRREF